MAESTMIVLVFEDEKAAERLFDTLQQTLKAESFPVDAAAVAVYEHNGEVTVRQMVHPLSESGFTPHLWEFMIKTCSRDGGITLTTGFSSSSGNCFSLVPQPSSP
jgi:uncharacterized membrane protein